MTQSHFSTAAAGNCLQRTRWTVNAAIMVQEHAKPVQLYVPLAQRAEQGLAAQQITFAGTAGAAADVDKVVIWAAMSASSSQHSSTRFWSTCAATPHKYNTPCTKPRAAVVQDVISLASQAPQYHHSALLRAAIRSTHQSTTSAVDTAAAVATAANT